MKYMVSSQEKPNKSPLYSIHTDLDSFIIYNDENLNEQGEGDEKPTIGKEGRKEKMLKQFSNSEHHNKHGEDHRQQANHQHRDDYDKQDKTQHSENLEEQNKNEIVQIVKNNIMTDKINKTKRTKMTLITNMKLNLFGV